ncbi:hypothetical protein PC123_g9533 [Phytophthora cactorum]|nr:hypothetical protein PC123_g9533 [Phytophthora cactorum]
MPQSIVDIVFQVADSKSTEYYWSTCQDGDSCKIICLEVPCDTSAVVYAIDFNAIWPLLRKEGWDAKHGTGMQIHHNYVKPGRRVLFLDQIKGALGYLR